jgi:DedD protein
MTHLVSDPEPRKTVIIRRLTGLAVLLIVLFVCSLLTRQSAGERPLSRQTLPIVVIPLRADHQDSANSNSSNSSPDKSPAQVTPSSAAPDPVMQRVGGPPTTTTTAPAPQPSEESKKVAPSPAALAPSAITKNEAKPKSKIEATPAPKTATTSPRWWVSVGAFRDVGTAQALAERIRNAGFKAVVSAIPAPHGEKLHRVSAGPFDKKDQAESARATLIVEGMTKAIVQPGH